MLVDVRAASVDVSDLKASKGFGNCLFAHVNRCSAMPFTKVNKGAILPNWFLFRYNINLPRGSTDRILGREGAGVIRQVGRDVSGLRVGDCVWFVAPSCMQVVVVEKSWRSLLLPPFSFLFCTGNNG